jgi:hypothetical protein
MEQLSKDDQFRVETAANETGVSIRRNYSGRGMYGDHCFGLTGGLRDAFKFFAALGRDDAEQEDNGIHDVNCELANDLASNATIDNMGRDFIVYFPRFSVAADDTTYEDE